MQRVTECGRQRRALVMTSPRWPPRRPTYIVYHKPATRASYQYPCMVRTAGRYVRRMHAISMHSTTYAAWHQTVPICTEWWCTEANEATQTHCYNPVAPAYPIWAYYAHVRQRRCQEDPVSLPSGRLEKTTRSSPHHVAQHLPTWSETTPPYAPRSSRFGSELPSVEDDVDV